MSTNASDFNIVKRYSIFELINWVTRNTVLRFNQHSRKMMQQFSSAFARTFRPFWNGLPIVFLIGLLAFALVTGSPFGAGLGPDAGVVVELELETAEDGKSRDQSRGYAAHKASAAIVELRQWLISRQHGKSRTAKKINAGIQKQTRAPPVRI